MQITIDTLKKTIAKLGYKWFEDRPNLIGIRTTLDIPDAFNDFMCCVWKENGIDTLKIWAITTDPGTYWLNHPMNAKGTSVLKKGQYINAWQLGLHQNKPDHPALCQIAPVTVWRDKDLDNTAEEQGTLDTGIFGINIHRSNKSGVSPRNYNWSAGCLVFQEKIKHDQLLWVCNKYKEITGNKFSLSLIGEKDLVA